LQARSREQARTTTLRGCARWRRVRQYNFGSRLQSGASEVIMLRPRLVLHRPRLVLHRVLSTTRRRRRVQAMARAPVAVAYDMCPFFCPRQSSVCPAAPLMAPTHPIPQWPYLPTPHPSHKPL
jgi:hypothetical protein